MRRLRKGAGVVPIVAVLLLLGSLFLVTYFRAELTGRVVLQVQKGTFYAYELISGDFNLDLNANEYLPASTTIKAEINGKTSTLTLEEMIAGSGLSVDKQQGNFSVENVSITGFGEVYGSEQGLNLQLKLDAFNLRVEETGNYDLTVSLIYNDIMILSEEAKIKIKACTPEWKQKNTSCMSDDALIGYYTDKNKCYEKTGYAGYLEGMPENITYICDYCEPNWKQHNTSCSINDFFISYYEDTKECYFKTGLESDLIGRSENVTLICDYCLPNWKPKNTSCQKNDTLTAYYADTKKCYSKTNLTSDLGGKPENATLTCDYCKLNLTQYNTTCSINDSYLVWYKDNNKCYSKTGLESDKVPANTTLTCDYCTPSLTQYNTSCSIEDTSIVYYNDSNKCYEKTSLESDMVPANISYSCDFCISNWTAVNTSCLLGDMIVTWYNDTNSCYEKTNLTSDLQGRQDNVTHKLVCDYEGNNILGNISNINTTIKNLSLMIGKSTNLTKSFSDLQEIIIKENGSELLEFNFNFSTYSLNLANLVVQKQAENATRGFVVVKGIDITAQNQTKTIWLERISEGVGVCVKDEENVDAESISDACNSSNEFLVKCPGSLAGYVCEFDASLGKYKVSGLRHSAVIEMPAFCGDSFCNGAESCSSCSADCGECPTQSTSSGGGGGGGGTPGGGCLPEWKCSEWSACAGGKQTRTCANLKPYCPVNKPAEEQECQVQEKPEEIPKPSENITTPETQPTTEKPQVKGNIIGAVVGVFGVLPAGLKIAVLVQILTLIVVLVIALTFLRIVTKGRKTEQVTSKPEQPAKTPQPSQSTEQNQQNSEGSQTSNSSSSNDMMPDTE